MTKLRIIFTDVGGVLNPHWKTKWSKLCKDLDLKPVITSTWWLNHTKEQLQNIFIEQDINVEIYDFTPHDKADRVLEIKTWLSNNVIDSYVVIDDKTSDIVKYVGNVVKVRSCIGLTHEVFEKI